jgi:hypothetical protein
LDNNSHSRAFNKSNSFFIFKKEKKKKKKKKKKVNTNHSAH